MGILIIRITIGDNNNALLTAAVPILATGSALDIRYLPLGAQNRTQQNRTEQSTTLRGNRFDCE